MSRPLRPRRTLPLPPLVAGALLVAALFPSCDGCREKPSGEVTLELVDARDRAAECGIFQNEGWIEARRILQPIVDREDAAAEDLLRMACAFLGEEKPDDALSYLERAGKLATDDPVLHWCRFRVARIRYENEEALRELREVRRLAPNDLPSRITLAVVLADLAGDHPDDKAYAEEAERELRSFLEIPKEYTAAWRITALFRLGSFLMRSDRADEAQVYMDEYQTFVAQGIEAPGEPKHQPGTMGEIRPHTRAKFEVQRPSAPSALEIVEIPDSSDALGLALPYLEPGPTYEGPEPALEDIGGELGGKAGEELWTGKLGSPRLVLFGHEGLRVLARAPDGSWSLERKLLDESVVDVLAFDRGNRSTEPSSFNWRRDGMADPTDPKSVDKPELNPDLDLLVLAEREGKSALFVLDHRREGPDEIWTVLDPLLSDSGKLEAGRVVAADLDHEGDLDLVIGTPEGVRVFRNDDFNVSPTGMTEVTAELPLPPGDLVPIAEDFDRDGDTDLLFVERSSGRLHFLGSDRGWRFADNSDRMPATAGRFIVLEDLDGSGFADVASFGDALKIALRDVMGNWAAPQEWPLASPPTGAPVATDWDLDGTTDLLWPTAGGGVSGILAPGFATGGVAVELVAPRGPRTDGSAEVLRIADLDGDFDQDLVVLDAGGARAGITPGAGTGFTFDLRGYRDNARGVGAIVELREGFRYRRLFWRGEPQLLGMGGDGKVDVVRITWPTAVIQNHIGIPAGADYLAWQRPGLAGSCPFLYVWNGTTYEFVSDVLGITPLGLPMAPGMLVPPDHDEFVLVSGDVLQEKDGFYELQFTEELREVTYLDRIRLDVVDHPRDVEVFPNERFSFPPFPEHHTHTVKDPLLPLSAVGSDGQDWTAQLSTNDRSFALPFTPLGGQFRGLATPHFLELAFDPERVKSAPRLRLVMNGWFFWTDASVNVAAARHSDAEFIPPLLQVPDGSGGWKDAGPPFGFPAGKLKTMVVDVTELLNRDDPRMRIFTTLQLYWDSIRLAVDGDDAPFVTTPIEPSSAVLWERGFSEPILFPGLEGEHGLEWFAWEHVAAEPRWNQHPGLYTRYGESLELVGAIDDRFVVMGAGDALSVRFDAQGAPPLQPGWERDFLVFLDGWAKDRDPNTLEALFVEPFPFHGMSSYPYGPDEHFPDGDAHRAWRREWLTRDAKSWIRSLVPPRPPPPVPLGM